MTKGGRPRDEVWERVTRVEGGKTPRWQCNDCGRVFAGSASRIKPHLEKVKGKGIRPCPGKAKSINGRVIMKKVGRPRDKVWERVTPLEGGRRWKCNDCGEEFAGGASRIKAHVNKAQGEGIRPCEGDFWNSLGDIVNLREFESTSFFLKKVEFFG
ncbi:hypothetical protein K1719_039887 [Acacia pycnantha]|nr:hypothetical protein K1719_039887 [Acacia pycnantha]